MYYTYIKVHENRITKVYNNEKPILFHIYKKRRSFPMVSHTSLGGLELSVGKGGLRFKKRPSGYNICIGKKLKGEPGPKMGRYDKAFQAKFTAAAKACSKVV